MATFPALQKLTHMWELGYGCQLADAGNVMSTWISASLYLFIRPTEQGPSIIILFYATCGCRKCYVNMDQCFFVGSVCFTSYTFMNLFTRPTEQGPRIIILFYAIQWCIVDLIWYRTKH